MSKTWYQVYLDDISKKGTIENYINYKIKKKKKLINLIKKYSPRKKIIEAGSGTGILSVYMASLGYDVIGIDIDNDILKLSIDISNKYLQTNKPQFINQSIFELNYPEKFFDVSFSNGVLEHFTDEEIIDTLKQQIRISEFVIFGIPTRYFKHCESMYGDERYLKLKYWRELIKKADGIILEEKSMHYATFKNICLNYKKYFKPYPYRIFVIKSEGK